MSFVNNNNQNKQITASVTEHQLQNISYRSYLSSTSREGFMNKIYRVIFNRALGVYQVTSELTASQQKKSQTSSAVNKSPIFEFALSGIAFMLLAMGYVSPSFAAANPCAGFNTALYDLCYVGPTVNGQPTFVGNYNTTNGWVDTLGNSANAPSRSINKGLITGENTRVSISSDTSGTLDVLNGATLIYKNATIKVNNPTITFRGNNDGDKLLLSTLQFDTDKEELNFRTGSNKLILDDYSRFYVSNYAESRQGKQKHFANKSIYINGQNLFFDVEKGQAYYLDNALAGVQDGIDPTYVNGEATRVMTINRGDGITETNGDIGFTPDSGLNAYVDKWIVNGGRLTVLNAKSLGINDDAEVIYDLKADSGVLSRYITELAPKDGLRFATFYTQVADTFNQAFEIKNADTYLKFDTTAADDPSTLNGNITGNGGVIFSSITLNYGKYELNGDFTYRGDTLLDFRNQLYIKKENSLANYRGDWYFAGDGRMDVLKDNFIVGDFLLDEANPNYYNAPFDTNIRTLITIGNYQDPDATVHLTHAGYSNEELDFDIQNGRLTQMAGRVGDGAIPSNLADANSLQDGFYGIKVKKIEGSNTPQFVASEADYRFNDMTPVNPWRIADRAKELGITDKDPAEAWQQLLDQLYAEDPTGLSIGSTLELKHNSLKPKDGSLDPYDDIADEILFTGRFLRQKNQDYLLNAFDDGRALNSQIVKSGDGKTVFTNSKMLFEKKEGVDDEGVPYSQLTPITMNFNVTEGTLDWRMSDAYDKSKESENPNVINIYGGYQTQAGATTSISAPETYLRIKKMDAELYMDPDPDSDNSDILSGVYGVIKGVYLPNSGNFILKGTGANLPNFFDTDTNEWKYIYDSSRDSQRATLDILIGGVERPEIYAEGKVDIQGALLNLKGLGAGQDGRSLIKSSELKDTQFTVIHASDGFIGGDFIKDAEGNQNNLTAVFANNFRPASELDYLTGGDGLIINCNFNINANEKCIVDKNSTMGLSGADTSKYAQEYVIRGLELSWYHEGDLPSITGNFTIDAANISFEVDRALNNRADDDIKRNSDGLFESDYGFWDGKTLTKKGLGTLILSADNTYTNGTYIDSGTLQIDRDENLGDVDGKLFLGNGLNANGSTLKVTGTTNFNSQRDVVLGRRDDNTVDVVESAQEVTWEGNVKNSDRFINAVWSSPITGIAVPDQSNPPPDSIRITWVDSEGNPIEDQFNPDRTQHSPRIYNGAGLVKTGLGSLVLAPDVGTNKELTYDGDTEVLEGSLTFKGDTKKLEGNLYNKGKVTFDQSMNSSFAGDILKERPNFTFSFIEDDIIQLMKGVDYTVFKEGNGILTLEGRSELNWNVTGGGLKTSTSRFTGDVALADGTSLNFHEDLIKNKDGQILAEDGRLIDEQGRLIDSAGNLILDVKGNPQYIDKKLSSYSGKLYGETDSTLIVDGEGGLKFKYDTTSTIGNLIVGDTEKNNTVFDFTNEDHSIVDPDAIKAFNIRGNFLTKENATTKMGSISTYLDVKKNFKLEANSTLDIFVGEMLLDAEGKAINRPDILVEGTADISGANLKVEGLFESDDPNTLAISSNLQKMEYTLLRAKGGITGDFSNNSDFATNADVDYITGGASEIRNGTGSTQDYVIKGFSLSWLTANNDRAIGNFTLQNNNTIFLVDQLLYDRKDTSGNIKTFDNDAGTWDGQSLTKKGNGTLILSGLNQDQKETGLNIGTDFNDDLSTIDVGSNSFTGNTYINAGVLQIGKDAHLGNNDSTKGEIGNIHLGNALSDPDIDSTLRFTQSTSLTPFVSFAPLAEIVSSRDLYLGRRERNTIDVADSGQLVTFTGDVKKSERFTNAIWVNDKNEVVAAPADENNPPAGYHRAVWVNERDEVVANQANPPAGSMLRVEQKSGLIKEGVGELALQGDIAYDGDTEVNAGKLTLANSTDNVTGDLYNRGIVEFRQDMNSTFVGDIYGTPRARTLAVPNVSNLLTDSYVIKSGTGILTLGGNSFQNWDVTGGGLITSAERFEGNVLLDANTSLTFNQSATFTNANGQLIQKNNLDVYSGILVGADTSTLNVIGSGGLAFNYGNGSRVGNVVVGELTSFNDQATFRIQSQKPIDDAPIDAFKVYGDYTTNDLATTEIVGKNTYLDVAGTFTQKDNATLKVMLDLNNNRASTADVIAQNVNLGGDLEILGFSRVLCEDDTQGCEEGTFNPIKATDLANINYNLIRSETEIQGQFNYDVSQPNELANIPGHPLYGTGYFKSGFLMFTDSFTTEVINGKTYYLYNIDKPVLTWNAGDNGTFDLETPDNAFNVDVVLTDRTPTTNGVPDVNGDNQFDSGWDGKTLTKDGEGELELSNNNTYTGDTIINEGTLTVSQDNNLGNTDPGAGNVGDIYLGSDPSLGNNESTLNIECRTGNPQGCTTPFETDRDVILANRDDNTINVEDPNATFNGKISGTGTDSGLTKTGGGELILTNPDNSYQGETHVVDGTLTLAKNDNVLDNSSDVILEDGTTLKVDNGTDQTINNIQSGTPDGNNSPSIIITTPGGELTFNNTKDTEFDGTIDGEVDLIVKTTPGNNLTLSGNLEKFKGDTTIEDGSELIISGKHKGTSPTNKDKGEITTNVTGLGPDSELEITEGGILTGTTDNVGKLVVTGKKGNDSSEWIITDTSNVGTLDLNKGGKAGFIAPKPDWIAEPGGPVEQGRDLIIDNLVNDGTGVIKLYTRLDDDDSDSDKIIINKSVTGTTLLDIQNNNGKGAQTVNGIKVVDVNEDNGVTTTNDSFKLAGEQRVRNGLFDYYLKRGDASGNGDDWFLRSNYNPNGGGENDEGYTREIDIARNFSQAANQFGLITLGTYHDRVGANTSTMYHKELQPHTPWLRVFGESGNVENASNINQQLASGANYDYTVKGIQVGFDFYEETDKEEVRRVSGLYFSHANMENDVYSATNKKLGNSSFDSNSLGYYYTRTNKEQAYFDFVAQYSRYSNIKGSSSTYEHALGSKGWAALVSGEVGYPYYLDDAHDWKLEPQAQLIYQYTKLDETLDGDYRYTPESDQLFTGRLGARLAYHTVDKDNHPFDAFIRANYWHTFDNTAVTHVSTIDGSVNERLEMEQRTRKLQFGLGVTYEPDTNWQIYAGIDYNKLIGDSDGDSISGHLGLKFAF